MPKDSRPQRPRRGRSNAAGAPSADDLAELRKEIQRIDREIVRLVGARQRAAQRIGAVKAGAGLPIRDFATEKEVRSRATHQGKRLGIDASLIEAVMGSLIEGAVRTQEEIKDTSYEGALKRVLILGGRGKMGTWLARYFHGQGHRVATFDPAGELPPYPRFATVEEGAEWAEVVLLATPLETAPQTLADVLALRPTGLVADIFSLKSSVADSLREAARGGLRVASLHPLFGPDAILLSGRTVLICDAGDREAAREIRSFFTPTSLSIRDVSLEEHDRAMAIVLGLSHAINLVFCRALVNSGFSFGDLQAFASTTFQKQVRTAAELAAENPRLYHSIQSGNRETAAVLGLLDTATREFRAAALASDPSAFVEGMRSAHEWFERPGPESPKRRSRRGMKA